MTPASPQGNLRPYAAMRVYRQPPPRARRAPRSFLWEASRLVAKLSLMVLLTCAILSLPHLNMRTLRHVGAMLPDSVGNRDAIRKAASRVTSDFDSLAPRFGSKPRQTFGMGSSKETVLAAQGRPTSTSGGIWRYGASEVYFVGDRVAGWHDSPSNPLMLR